MEKIELSDVVFATFDKNDIVPFTVRFRNETSGRITLTRGEASRLRDFLDSSLKSELL